MYFYCLILFLDFNLYSLFVFQNARDSAIYIGTTKNTILEGSANKKTFKIAVWGHTGKLEAIAAHPDDLAFVSAGKNQEMVFFSRFTKAEFALVVFLFADSFPSLINFISKTVGNRNN